jgi:hypothetical protein
MIEENKRLKAEAENLNAKISALEKMVDGEKTALQEKDKHLADLDSAMDKFFPTDKVTQTIEVHSAPEIIPNVLRIGLSAVSPFNSYVSATINQEYYSSLPLGVPKETKVADRICTVTVTKITNTTSILLRYVSKDLKR